MPQAHLEPSHSRHQPRPLVPFRTCRGDENAQTEDEGSTYIHSEYLLLFPKCKRNEKEEKRLTAEQTLKEHYAHTQT